eukprot:TRINITY_DN2336_c0_g1_i1.p1 TRINITY_DN2336_c0_g1~~TRINITY_DN2336_c0_g1_i1.p1  ORF type:complete len:172 (-),score=35.48 TRINITY_DN2336_c0_g1_i1:146-607(-)
MPQSLSMLIGTHDFPTAPLSWAHEMEKGDNQLALEDGLPASPQLDFGTVLGEAAEVPCDARSDSTAGGRGEPCAHNGTAWKHLRTKAGLRHMVCTICGRKWRQSSSVPHNGSRGKGAAWRSREEQRLTPAPVSPPAPQYGVFVSKKPKKRPTM